MIKERTKSATSTSSLDIPQNWKKSDGYTGDELIDAYLQGKEAGIEIGWTEKMKILVNQFAKNLDAAVKISEALYDEAKGQKISLKEIHLKAEGLSKFTSLFVADADDFVSDNFLKVQTIAREYKGNKKDPDVYLSILFMPYSEKINNDCLSADGYFLTYDKKK